jgi:hypothetical protein
LPKRHLGVVQDSMGSDERDGPHPPTNPSDWEPAALPLTAESRDDDFGKSEIRPSKKFLFRSDFSHKKGGLALGGGHARLKSNYNDLKGRFKKMQVYAGGVQRSSFDLKRPPHRGVSSPNVTRS